MNHAAVRAVSMHTLNRQRANIVLSNMLADGTVLTPEEVSLNERIFERDGALRWKGGKVMATAKIGVSLQTLVQSIGQSDKTTGSFRETSIDLEDLIDAFRPEEYILWYDSSHKVSYIVLKAEASVKSQLKAWCHALWLVQGFASGEMIGEKANDQAMLRRLTKTLGELSLRWTNDIESLRAAGWDLDTGHLETAASTRIRLLAGSSTADA